MTGMPPRILPRRKPSSPNSIMRSNRLEHFLTTGHYIFPEHVAMCCDDSLSP
jgi:hypothetical protein